MGEQESREISTPAGHCTRIYILVFELAMVLLEKIFRQTTPPEVL